MNFRKALVYTFTSKYLLLIIQFGSTLILSRLLTPADIGIYTIAYSLVAIGHVFRDFGVGNYIQQEKDLTTDRIRAAMTITLLFAWLMALALYFGANYAASFYNEDGIKKVFQVLALNFLLIPFGSVTTSYIRRQMRFKFVMKLEVVCSLVSTATVITLAYAGFSYMSMAWSSVAGIIVEISILVYFRPTELPRLPGLKDVKHVLKFSYVAVSETLISQLGGYLPDLIVGKVLGMQVLGLLSRAKGTEALFDRVITSAIQPVLLPFFSKQNRAGENIKKPYLHVLMCVTGLAWPALIYMILMAEPLIYVLYGSQWTGAAILLKIICIRQMLGRLMHFINPILVSKGHVKALLKMQMFFVPLELAILILALPYGLISTLYVLCVIPIIRTLIIIRILNKIINVTFNDYFNIILKCGLPTLMCAVPIYIIRNGWYLNEVYSLILSAVITGIIFMLSIFLFKHPLSSELIKIKNKITYSS